MAGREGVPCYLIHRDRERRPEKNYSSVSKGGQEGSVIVWGRNSSQKGGSEGEP